MTSNNKPRVIIAVFGATGTGKSTFINDASGSKVMEVSDSIESCTQRVMAAPDFELDGRQITLIDTPGFDDTYKSDVDILKNIGNFLKDTYEEGHLLDGILFMQRITDPRVGGASSKNFRVFRQLCGTRALPNVVFTTNMWSDPPAQVELDREAELKEKFFKPALQQGAQMARYIRQRGVQSAHAIIRACLGNQPTATQLGEELAAGRTFGNTGAGQELIEAILMLMQNHMAELKELKAEIEATRKQNEELHKEIQEENADLQKQVTTLQEEIEKLHARDEEGPMQRKLMKLGGEIGRAADWGLDHLLGKRWR